MNNKAEFEILQQQRSNDHGHKLVLHSFSLVGDQGSTTIVYSGV